MKFFIRVFLESHGLPFFGFEFFSEHLKFVFADSLFGEVPIFLKQVFTLSFHSLKQIKRFLIFPL